MRTCRPALRRRQGVAVAMHGCHRGACWWPMAAVCRWGSGCCRSPACDSVGTGEAVGWAWGWPPCWRVPTAGVEPTASEDLRPGGLPVAYVGWTGRTPASLTFLTGSRKVRAFGVEWAWCYCRGFIVTGCIAVCKEAGGVCSHSPPSSQGCGSYGSTGLPQQVQSCHPVMRHARLAARAGSPRRPPGTAVGPAGRGCWLPAGPGASTAVCALRSPASQGW